MYTMRQYGNHYKYIEDRIQDYRNKSHNHILRMDFSRLALKPKNYQPDGRSDLDDRGYQGEVVFETEQANKTYIEADYYYIVTPVFVCCVWLHDGQPGCLSIMRRAILRKTEIYSLWCM
jgi:hypothetical protein